MEFIGRTPRSSVRDKVNNPKTPTDNLYRVYRGGTWLSSSASIVRAAYRNDDAPSYRLVNVGFRCAQRGAKMPVGKVTP